MLILAWCFLSTQVDVSDSTKTAEAFLKIASVYKEENHEVKDAVLDSVGQWHFCLFCCFLKLYCCFGFSPFLFFPPPNLENNHRKPSKITFLEPVAVELCFISLPVSSSLTHTHTPHPQMPSSGKPLPRPPSKGTTLSRLCWCCSDSSRCVRSHRSVNAFRRCVKVMCSTSHLISSRARTRWSPCWWFPVTSRRWSTWCARTTSPRRTWPCCRLSCPGKEVNRVRRLSTRRYRTHSLSPSLPLPLAHSKAAVVALGGDCMLVEDSFLFVLSSNLS